MTDNAPSDQAATQQSLMDRIAASFGVPQEEPPPQPEQEQPDEQPTEEVATSEDSGDAQQESPPSEEFLEIEFEGEKYQVPPKLKDALLRQSDYTKKTQEVAEQRKALEAVQATIKAQKLQEEFQQQTRDDREKLLVLDKVLEQAKAINWAEMSTDQIVRTKMQIDDYKEQRQQIVDSLKSRESQFVEQVNSELTQTRNQVLEQVGKTLQGFDAKALTEYFTREGLTSHEIEGVLLDPRSVSIAWKARQWDALQATKSEAVQKAQKAPPVIKPSSSRPMPNDVKDKLNYRKAIKSAPDSNAKAKLIQQRLERMFGA